MITIHDCEQGSEAWHKLRDGLYTGSNADKLLKYGAIDYSLTTHTNFRGNYWTKRGHILEPEAIELYEAITGVKVERPGFVTNSKYPNAGYSPDGLASVPLLEIKCFDIPAHMELIKGNIPLKILAQIHFGLLITERPFAHLIPYNSSDELEVKDQFKIITIKANRNIQANLKRILTNRKEPVPA